MVYDGAQLENPKDEQKSGEGDNCGYGEKKWGPSCLLSRWPRISSVPSQCDREQVVPGVLSAEEYEQWMLLPLTSEASSVFEYCSGLSTEPDLDQSNPASPSLPGVPNISKLSSKLSSAGWGENLVALLTNGRIKYVSASQLRVLVPLDTIPRDLPPSHSEQSQQTPQTPQTPQTRQPQKEGSSDKERPAGKKAFRFIELFAGIGGFRVGLETLGGECVFASEIEPEARKTYLRNFHEPLATDPPNGNGPAARAPAKFYGDITRIHSKDIPDHDVLTAGFPCQPFSTAKYKTRAGLANNAPYAAMVRVILEKRPRTFVLENVRGLLIMDNG